MRIRPTRTVDTQESCPSCGEPIRHREVGFAATPAEPLTWLVASRFCAVGCRMDERKPGED
jgi:hypothetical protein